MIKRFRVPYQLLIIFLSVIFITFILLMILLGNRINGYSESITLQRLTSMIDISKEYWDNENEEFNIDSSNTIVSYIRIINIDEEKIITYSDNINNIIKSEDEINSIINNINLISLNKGVYVGNYSISGKLFYAYEISENNNAIIIITNSNYANSMKDNMQYETMIIFFIVLSFAAVIIFVWGKSFTLRIYRLNTHVKNLPIHNYEGKYVDDGNDEIADLSITIEEMRTELLNSENDKREMLQNISHDFKTPISVIRSYSEAIKDGIEGQDGLDIIMNQCDILENKVKQLLQYNSLEYLKKDRNFEEINMKELILQIVELYKHNKFEIITNLDDSIFMGYKENFYTVIDNILDNAKRYAKQKIIITLEKGILTIFNDGESIEDKFINGIFKPYEKGSKGQFGLGMSIVKKTLDFFLYDLYVKNEEQGVSFTIKKRGNTNINAL